MAALGRALSQCLNTTDEVSYLLSTGVPEVAIVVLEVIFS